MVNLMGTSGEAQKALGTLGVSAYDEQGKFKGLHTVLEELRTALASCTDQQRDQFTAMIGGKTQLAALQAMLQATGSTYDKLKGQIDNANGATEEMYETMQNNDKGSFEAMKSAMEACAIAIHDALQPAIMGVLKSLTNFFSWFAKLSPETQKIIVSLAGLVVGFTGVTLVLGTFLSKLGICIKTVSKIPELISTIKGLNIIASIGKLGNVFSSVIGIIQTGLKAVFTLMAANPIVATITIVIGLLVLLYAKCEPFRNFVNDLGAKLKEFGAFLLNWFKELPQHVSNLWTSIQNTCITWWNNIKTFFISTIPQTIENLWQSISNTCSNWWNNIIAFFTSSIPTIINQIGQWFLELPGKIAYALGYALGSIIKWGSDCLNYLTTNVPVWINNIGTWFSELPNKIWTWLNDTLNRITQWGANVVNWLTTNVPKWIESIGNYFAQLPEKIWTWLVNTYNKIADWGKNVINWITVNVSNWINTIVNYFSQLPGQIWNWLSNTWNQFVTWGENMINTAREKMNTCGTSIIDAFRNLPSKMLDIGRNIVNGIKDGIKSAWDGMVGWMGDLCDSFVDGVKDALDIHSPSRIFRDQVGKFIPQGIQVGIESEMPNLDKSIKQQLNHTVAIANDSVGNINKKSTAYDKESTGAMETLSNKLDKLISLVSNLDLDISLDGQSLVKKTAPAMNTQIAFNNNRRRF